MSQPGNAVSVRNADTLRRALASDETDLDVRLTLSRPLALVLLGVMDEGRDEAPAPTDELPVRHAAEHLAETEAAREAAAGYLPSHRRGRRGSRHG